MWQANAVQLAIFCQTIDGVEAQELFKTGLGREPDSTQRNRTISPANPFLSVAAGLSGAVNHTVQVQTGHIDVHVAPIPPAEIDLDNPAPLFNVEPVLAELVEFVRRVAGQLPAVVRVALVGTLMSRVDDYQTAAGVVGSMLGADVNRPDISDLMFQINRRKPMGHGQSMNRLIRLNVAEIQAVTVQQGLQANGVVAMIPIQTMASLQLDFNTVPSPVGLPADSVIPLIEEINQEILRVGRSENPLVEVLNHG